MRLRDTYDVPEEIAAGPHSQAFAKFLQNWFGDTRRLTNGELDLTFLKELSIEERGTAKQLIRRNLYLRQSHIITGAWALGDLEAVPALRALLADELDMSRRLTIAGALWKLAKDPVFLTCLEQAKAIPTKLLGGFHMAQVLWIDDERSVDFLIDLLDHADSFVRFQALLFLNSLELGREIRLPESQLPHQVEEYRRRRPDQAFRQMMTAAVRKRNQEVTNGW